MVVKTYTFVAAVNMAVPFLLVSSVPGYYVRDTFRFKLSVLFLTWFAYTTYHLSRKPISVVKTVLHQNETNASYAPFDNENYKDLFGALDYSFLAAYAIGMFCSGHIAERSDLRYFLSIGMLLSGIFTALFGFAKYWQIHSLAYFIVIQALAGFAQSSGWPSVVACMANWYGKGKRGLIMGLWNSHTSCGNILGALIAGAFVDSDWALSFIVPGAIIALMGLITFLFLVPRPEDVGCPKPIQHISQSSVQARLEREPLVAEVNSDDPLPHEPAHSSVDEAISPLRALKIPGVIEFSLCLFFAKLVSYTFLFWLPYYINKTADFKHSPQFAVDVSTAFDVGGVIGAIFAGVISDYIGGRAMICSIMLTLAAPALWIYQLYGATSVKLCAVLLVISGALVNGPYGLITTAVSADLGTHQSLRGNARALSTVTAIIDGTGSIGAALGPALTGVISNSGKADSWKNVFYMLIAADIFAILFLLRLTINEVKAFICQQRSQRLELGREC